MEKQRIRQNSENVKTANLRYNIQKCLSVWTSIVSAPGPDTDMRPVSLERAWPEGGPLENNFSEKWPVAKSPQ